MKVKQLNATVIALYGAKMDTKHVNGIAKALDGSGFLDTKQVVRCISEIQWYT